MDNRKLGRLSASRKIALTWTSSLRTWLRHGVAALIDHSQISNRKATLEAVRLGQCNVSIDLSQSGVSTFAKRPPMR
jgi:hypothetical protein